MLLATLILSAAIPQAVPPEAPPLEATAIQESAPMPPPEAPASAMGIEASELPPPPGGAFQEHIEAGLKAFIRGRFPRARDAFEKSPNLCDERIVFS